MTGGSLTDDTITPAMERAITRLRADRSRPQRLTLMPNALDHVLAHVGADGWVEIGVIVDPDWPHDWRVWLNVESREGRLRAWARR
jgi:hypothetical protein